MNNKIANLTKYVLDELSKLPKVVLFTQKDCLNGVVSFRIDGVSPSEVVEYFNEKGICVRGGLHCAPLCHKKMGTIDGGTIRVSISSFNHKWETIKFVKELKKFLEIVKV
jgi:selenocysteine lyase/cysteine desulfurase